MWSFSPTILFLNFPNILQRTCIAFIVGQREQFYYFQKPKLHFPPMWESSQNLILGQHQWRALGMLLGTAAEACHIWKPSTRMTSPWEPIQHKPCLQELAEFFGPNLEGEELRKNWPNEERISVLMARRSPV